MRRMVDSASMTDALAGVPLFLYLLLGPVIAVLLTGFADNGRLAATVIANGVVGPFFFLGLSLLYFEQKARKALSGAPPVSESSRGERPGRGE